MHIEKREFPSFFGVDPGIPPTYRLVLSKRELETVKRADQILDQVRDAIRESMGTEDFEQSAYFVLYIDELAESDRCPIEWTREEAVRLTAHDLGLGRKPAE